MSEMLKGWKLGTCENLYYTTYQQLKKWTIATKEEKKPFIKLNSGYRFRFPFPDEKIQLGHYKDFDRGVFISVPKNIGIETYHHKISHTLYAGDKHTSISIDCILSASNKAEIVYNSYQGETIIEIVQQKYTDYQGQPELVTIARCPYCKNKFQLSHENILQMLIHFKELQIAKSKRYTNQIETNATIIDNYNPDEYNFIIDVLTIAEGGYKTI